MDSRLYCSTPARFALSMAAHSAAVLQTRFGKLVPISVWRRQTCLSPASLTRAFPEAGAAAVFAAAVVAVFGAAGFGAAVAWGVAGAGAPGAVVAQPAARATIISPATIRISVPALVSSATPKRSGRAGPQH